MKKFITILTRLGLLILTSCNEEIMNPASVTEFTIESATNGATYDIKVARPADFFTSSEKFAGRATLMS